ncbi:MAG: preprotein translocase subunit Sec61beta [Candidatus Diapherotrites archaeon]|nr:preprotein translocase subunit Sec61beta [Candidatus Diapherotrites archaeon]
MKITQSPVQGPTSAAGLVRYFDISGGGVEVTPELVFGLAAIFIIAEIVVWYAF